jgi:hypothetical protein
MQHLQSTHNEILLLFGLCDNSLRTYMTMLHANVHIAWTGTSSMYMDMQHGHGLCSMDMDHAAWTWTMQHEHLDMQNGCFDIKIVTVIVLSCFFALLIFILASFGLFWFYLVSVQNPKQKCYCSQNKLKQSRNIFRMWNVTFHILNNIFFLFWFLLSIFSCWSAFTFSVTKMDSSKSANISYYQHQEGG